MDKEISFRFENIFSKPLVGILIVALLIVGMIISNIWLLILFIISLSEHLKIDIKENRK